MTAIAQFLKTTLIGGLLVLVPIYVPVLLLLKAIAGMVALLHPVTALLPDRLHALRQVAALALIVLASFAFGLIVRTRPGRYMLGELERRVLEKIPGFAVVRGIVRRVSGPSDDEMFQPVLVELEEALTPAFVVEELDDDRFVVLVPSVPTPAAGSLYVLPRARVHWVDVPVTQAVAVITRWARARASSSRRCDERRTARRRPRLRRRPPTRSVLSLLQDAPLRAQGGEPCIARRRRSVPLDPPSSHS